MGSELPQICLVTYFRPYILKCIERKHWLDMSYIKIKKQIIKMIYTFASLASPFSLLIFRHKISFIKYFEQRKLWTIHMTKVAVYVLMSNNAKTNIMTKIPKRFSYHLFRKPHIIFFSIIITDMVIWRNKNKNKKKKDYTATPPYRFFIHSMAIN